jgi:hypothetical protein
VEGLSKGSSETGDDDAGFLFRRTPLQVVLPRSLGGKSLTARITGTWTNRLENRDTLIVSDWRATLTFAPVDIQLPRGQAVRIVKVPLTLGEWAMPDELVEFYGPANHGILSAAARRFRLTSALDARFRPNGPPARVLLQSQGVIERDGSTFAASTGLVISGPFAGVILACAGGRNVAPRICGNGCNCGGAACPLKGAHAHCAVAACINRATGCDGTCTLLRGHGGRCFCSHNHKM